MKTALSDIKAVLGLSRKLTVILLVSVAVRLVIIVDRGGATQQDAFYFGFFSVLYLLFVVSALTDMKKK